MGLKYIIEEMAERIGLSATTDRTLLVKLANRAAKELYEFEDLPGSLKEQVFLIPPDSQIALPYFVGEIRNMREYNSYERIDLIDMRPRYNYHPWPQEFRHWRLKHKAPIHTEPTVNGAITLEIHAADNTKISISGSTANSSKVTEKVTMDAISKTTTNVFREIYAITKDAVGTYDIAVKDADGTLLATVPNDQLESIYQIVDVSKLPSSTETTGGERYVEVLYKPRLTQMKEDGDQFPIEGFDDALVWKSLEHWYADEQKTELAVASHVKCAQVIAARSIHMNGPVQKMMTFAPNQYVGLHPRYRVASSNGK